jgi:integrase
MDIHEEVTFREEFKKFLFTKGLSESSVPNYIAQASAFMILNDKRLDTQISFEKAILEFYSSKKCYHVRYALKGLFDFLDSTTGTKYLEMLNKVISKNKYSFRAMERRIKKKFISKDELKKLIDTFGELEQLFFLVQYETACRAGALIKLNVCDIEKRENTVIISLKEKRDTNATFTLSEMLSKKMANRIQGKSILSSVWGFSFGYISKYLRKKAEILLGYPITTHFIRASRAVHLLQEGKQLISVKELLRHKSLDYTYKYLMDSGISQQQFVENKEIGWLYQNE